MFQRNEEQTGGKKNIDLNVVKAWNQGFNGDGVIVTTLDDGIDHDHPDIRNNYVRLHHFLTASLYSKYLI